MASEWQDLINPEDLQVALENFEKHCVDPNHPYDQIVRYRHKDGSTVWVRCRGIAIRDKTGKPVRMLGAHTNLTRQKKVEHELRESEAKFRSLVEITSDWIWEVDQHGTFTYASPKIKDLLGYDPQELIGKARPVDYMPADEAERIGRLLRDIVASSEPFDGLENINIHKDGHQVVLETSGVPIFDKAGNLTGYRGIDRDITERKRTEEALVRMAQEWQTTFDTTSDAIFLLDADMRIHRANKKAERLFDCPGGLIGRHCWEIVHGTEKPIPECPNMKAMQNFCRETTELQIGENWFRVAVDPILNNNGQYTGGVHVITDITELKLFTEKLKKNEKRYKFLAENMADIVWTLDMDLNATYVSPSVKKVLGFTPEERKQQKLEEVVTPDSLERISARFLEELKRDEEPGIDPDRTIVIDVEYYHRNGSIVWMENIVKAIRNENGDMIGTYGSSRDITERKAAQEALMLEKKKLEKALSEIKKLSGLLPICASCKNIRDDKGYWNQIESYIGDHSEAEFSHSICPDCAKKLYPDLDIYE